MHFATMTNVERYNKEVKKKKNKKQKQKDYVLE